MCVCIFFYHFERIWFMLLLFEEEQYDLNSAVVNYSLSGFRVLKQVVHQFNCEMHDVGLLFVLKGSLNGEAE